MKAKRRKDDDTDEERTHKNIQLQSSGDADAQKHEHLIFFICYTETLLKVENRKRNKRILDTKVCSQL